MINLLQDYNFWGAFIGSVITGIVAISIFFFDKRITQKEKKSEFDRIFFIELGKFHTDIVHMHDILDKFGRKEVKIPDVLETLEEFTQTSLNKMEKTNPKNLGNNIISDFFQIKEILEVLNILVKKLSDDYQYQDMYTRDDVEDKKELIKIKDMIQGPMVRIDNEYGNVKRKLDIRSFTNQQEETE